MFVSVVPDSRWVGRAALCRIVARPGGWQIRRRPPHAWMPAVPTPPTACTHLPTPTVLGPPAPPAVRHLPLTCSAKALSRYSDQVDSLIRAQMHKLNGASDDARIRLREWELPEVCALLSRLRCALWG